MCRGPLAYGHATAVSTRELMITAYARHTTGYSGHLRPGAAPVSNPRTDRCRPRHYESVTGPCTEKAAPNGSTRTAIRPNGVFSAAIATAPPPRCAADTEASTSATAK